MAKTKTEELNEALQASGNNAATETADNTQNAQTQGQTGGATTVAQPNQNTQNTQNTQSPVSGSMVEDAIAKSQGSAPQLAQTEKLDTTAMADTLKQSLDAAQQQTAATIDNSVKTSADDLNRALADAQSEYQSTRNQIALDERMAMDNAALNAQANGDRGGIGQSQYNSIQNAAAQSRLALNNAQTKAANDTARQVSELRAQGEFEKADQMLQLTQDYLAKLMTLQQWGAQYNLSVDEMNQSLAEWQASYDADMAQFRVNAAATEANLTGTYNGTRTLSGRSADLEEIASRISLLQQYGVSVSTSDLEAMGFTAEEAEQLAGKMNSSGSGSGYKNSQVDQNEVNLAVEAYANRQLGKTEIQSKAFNAWSQGGINEATYRAINAAIAAEGTPKGR